MRKIESRIEVRCTRSLRDQISDLAAKKAITQSRLIRDAINAYLRKCAKQAKTPTA